MTSKYVLTSQSITLLYTFIIMPLSHQEILNIIKPDFDAVNHIISDNLRSDVVLINQLANYVVQSGGKRLRPITVILAGRSAAPQTDETQANDIRLAKAAAIIEYIHTATLLHDDVVDASTQRRGRDTANTVWGNEAAVLVGDFLYSRAFQLMQDLDSLEIQNIFANATNRIAEGEVLQLLNIGNTQISEQEYLQVIAAKTAMLFEAGTEAGAILTGCNASTQVALKQYGHHLGVAFQLMDDVLDYEGDAELIGKNLGDDLAEGKPTLPIIYALKQATSEDKILLEKAIQEGDTSQLSRIQTIIHNLGGVEYTKAQAEKEASKAIQSINFLQESDYKTALISIAKTAMQRVM
jgi:octaprenyl-diphosphate synthase